MNNYDVSIFLISNEGELIFFNEYDKVMSPDIAFVMLTNDVLNSDYGENNSICVNKDWWYVDYPYQTLLTEMRYLPDDTLLLYEEEIENAYHKDDEGISYPEYLKKHIDEFVFDDYFAYPNTQQWVENNYSYNTFIWQVEPKVVDSIPCFPTKDFKPENDYNGYQNTVNALKSVQKMMYDYINNNDRNEITNYQVNNEEQYFPAFSAAYGETVLYKGRKVHGYLPALGQLLVLCKNIDDLHKVFKEIGSDEKTQYMISYISNDNDSKHKKFMDIISSTQADYENCWIIEDDFSDYIYPLLYEKTCYNLDDTCSYTAVAPLYKIDL